MDAPTTTFICPNCKKQIPVDQALKAQFNDESRKEYEEQRRRDREEDRKTMIAWREEDKKKILANNDLELKSLKEETERKNQEIKKFRESELELLNKEKILKEKLESADLEVARKINEERDKIKEKVQAEEDEKHRLKEKEYEQKMEMMKKSLEEAQRKASQGSQQLQGEVLELELEEKLKLEFPMDEIKEVGKGIKGADIIHKVYDRQGSCCGTIVWESKRTRTWDKKWTEDLKANMLSVKGDVAVLVSTILPEGINNFGFKEGVYITSYECFLSVAFILRKSIIEHNRLKQSITGDNEDMKMVYNYFLSSEFQQRISAIAEAFTAMKIDLDTEKRVFVKLWSKREKEIEKVILNTSSLHGELQGLIGSGLPTVKSLDFSEKEISVESTESEIIS